MQVSDQIIEVLNYLGEKLGVTIDWTSENVLPYVQTLCGKYINWEIATSVVWMVIGIVLIILAIPTSRYAEKCYNKYTNDPKSYYDFCAACLYILCTCFFIIGSSMIISQLFDIMKCIYIPELQIYEYVKSLM